MLYYTIVFLTVNHLFCMCLERTRETSAQLRASSFLILADDLTEFCKFRNAKGTISIKRHFIFLLFLWCKRFVYIMSKDLLCQSDVFDQSLIIIVRKHYPNDQSLCVFYFQYPSSYLINLRFSDTILNKLQNIIVL